MKILIEEWMSGCMDGNIGCLYTEKDEGMHVYMDGCMDVWMYIRLM